MIRIALVIDAVTVVVSVDLIGNLVAIIVEVEQVDDLVPIGVGRRYCPAAGRVDGGAASIPVASIVAVHRRDDVTWMGVVIAIAFATEGTDRDGDRGIGVACGGGRMADAHLRL